MAPPRCSLTLLSVLLSVLVGKIAGLQTCDVDCSHFSAGDDKADDPIDCHAYYLCFSDREHSEYPFNCPEGMMFDTHSKECKNPSSPGFECSPPCEPCRFDCSTPHLGVAADMNDCSNYYLCDHLGNIVSVESCPDESPFFDGSGCHKDPTTCCACKAFCTQEDAHLHTMIPDPWNCTNFYQCVSEGFAENHGHCPFGNFDPDTQDCRQGAACETECSDTFVTAEPDDVW